MKIEKLRTNHIENPIGFYIGELSLSWKVTEAKGKKTDYSRVEISEHLDFSACLVDTGKVKGLSSLDYHPVLNLKPGTRYYWRVSVWDDEGDSGISDTAFFETAAELDGAKWICAPFAQEIHPIFRKEFFLKKSIVKARLLISGLGLYEAALNGAKVSDEFFTPYFNDYDEWVQFQTFDVTDLLKDGLNVIEVMLGNGWYKGRFGYIDGVRELYGDSFKLIAKLIIVSDDEEISEINTDESWLCSKSPVLESSIYDGEIFDSRKIMAGCVDVSCNNAAFKAAKIAIPPVGKLVPRLSPPVKIKQRIQPVSLIHTPAHEEILDFGQILTGWVEFLCNSEKDTEILLQFGEILQDDCFYNENLRTAKQEFRYISDGAPALVRPHFTFYGFRYVKITGVENIDMSNFTACVIYSDIETCGKIETSDQKVNRLFDNSMWSQKGNFLDIPTDCPQRDERMGWTGDAQVFCATACYNMYTPAFYRKYMWDMKLEQLRNNGAIPHVIPDVFAKIAQILEKDGRKTDNISIITKNSACGWADAATIIPWTLYHFYGDLTMLSEQYEGMKSWTDRIHRFDKEECGGTYLWTCGFHFADWLALDNGDSSKPQGATDPFFVASVYYYFSSYLTSKAASVLGKKDDAEYYGDMAEKVKEAIRLKYFTSEGKIKIYTQTALVLALHFGLVPDGYVEEAKKDLLRRLKEDNMHLTTGFIGVSYLCPTLSINGFTKEAYSLFLNENYPSWLYEVNHGATTFWERWNSVLEDGHLSSTGMNSLNHYAFGSIVEWMYEYMFGLRVPDGGEGFRHFIVSPDPNSHFEYARMTFESPMGKIESSWEKIPGGWEFCIEIPFDTEAEFLLPFDCSSVTVNGSKCNIIKAGDKLELIKGRYFIKAVL